ncbi:MAG: prepilin-type N-terminal cleavage/methylation domain-containing protein [Rickettsiales bacterium]|nr:prepilin-type N-terminal cleavage/methylation domain-containing protein [Rickettsiales bacterium]
MKKSNKGFSLIELSIVLVIISLLIAGVLSGKSLIDSAKVKSVINEWTNIKISVFAYKVNTNSLPGDINDNGKIGYVQDAVAYEATGDVCNACGHYTGEYANKNIGTVSGPWVDLYLAGLSTFKPNPDSTSLSSLYQPVASQVNDTLPASKLQPDASIIIFCYNEGFLEVINEGCVGTACLVSNFKAKILKDIDTKIDDGKMDTGNVITSCTSATTYEDNINNGTKCNNIKFSFMI